MNRDRTGAAWVAALAATAAVSGLLAWAQARVAGRLASAAALAEEEELRVLAAEGCRGGMWRLANDADLAVDHSGEPWAQPVTVESGGATMRVRVEDAGRRLDWNNLACAQQPGRDFPAVARVLLVCCGRFGGESFVDALRDYADPDADGPWEDDAYRRAGRETRPANRPLWGAGELRSVAGFASVERPDPEAERGAFDGDLWAASTVVPAAREATLPVNVNTAGREVLLAVAGLEREALVGEVEALRTVRPLESLSLLAAASPGAAAALQGALDVRSRHYLVTAEVRNARGRRWRAEAWVERGDDGAVRCLQWREGSV